MEIKECWFCGSRIYPGHGSIYIKNNCEHFYFCRSKCKKLFKLGKNSLFLRWCNNFRKKKGKFIVVQKTTKNDVEVKLRSPSNYNNLILKFTLLLLKRSNKQNIKKNTIYKKIFTQNTNKVV